MKSHVFTEYNQARITIHEINGTLELDVPIKLNCFHLIMLKTGKITTDVNFHLFDMADNSTLHLSAGDTIRQLKTSSDLTGYHIIFSQEFQNEMRTIRKSPVNLQLKKEFPYQEFTEEEYGYLELSVRKILRYISKTDHCYRSLVIKNEVLNLILDISDKRREQHSLPENAAQDRHEQIRNRFINLINGYSSEHHNVSWYAEALKISSDYLSKIIREHDGSSALAWINKSIIDSAKQMLRQNHLSIKEISSMLNFPDQSSFGRFFKANTGHSPKDYRKGTTDVVI